MASDSVFLPQFRKAQHTVIGSTKVRPKKVFFQLAFEQNRAYICTVDQKYSEVDVDYLNYGGALFTALRSFDTVKEKNNFQIDWDGTSNKVYLDEHEFIIKQLNQCNNVINETGEPIIFSKDTATFKLLVNGAKVYQSQLTLTVNDDVFTEFRLLCDSYVLINNTIYKTPAIGNNYSLIRYFNSKVPADQINQFLSIFYSHLANVDLSFKEYNIVESEENITTYPVLFFDKIDEDNALFLRVGQALPGFPPDFYRHFDLVRIAEVNEMEEMIIVRNIDQQSTDSFIEEVAKVVKKCTTTKEERNEVIEEDDLFIIPNEIANRFVINELPNLLTTYKVFGAERLKSYNIKAAKPVLNLKLDHGIDFLEGDAVLDFDNQSISLFDAINQYNKQNYILLSDGTKAIVNETYIRKLERIFKKKKNKVSVSFFDLPLVEELIDEKIATSTFAKHREIFEGFNNISSTKPKIPTVTATLRDYQKEGFKWINYLHEKKLGGCLADDMGLGKTLQAIVMLSKIYPKETKPSLIVMPKSLLFNWKNEIEKFNKKLSVYVYYGNDRDMTEACKHNLVFTTYAMMRNDIEQFKEVEFYYLILDESQNIKNINALTTKAVMLLQSGFRLALSGTPIENNLGELYSLFRFLNPAMFGTVEDFNRNYGIPIQKHNDQDAILALRKKIYPFILRRLKKDVLTELPDCIQQELYVEMNDDQKRFYEQRRQYYRDAIKQTIAQQGIQKSQFFLFQALSELRQIASIPESKSDGAIESPKVEMLLEYLLDAVANRHKVIVFVNFLASIELIGEKLDAEGIEYISMSGSTHERQKLVDRFQQDKNCKVFIMTLKTGGVGLNLTAADTVFIFEPWWNRAAEMQAINRTHRIGQTQKVLSYRIITQQTIEEKMLQLQLRKAELFENIIGNDTASIKSLSEEDIDFILS